MRILRTQRTRGHPCPRPASPAGNLIVLRCSANLMGPRWTNPPSMAGCRAVSTALLRVLASVHARSAFLEMHEELAMDGGLLEWGPSEPPSIAGRSGPRPRRGRGHGWPRVRCVRRMRTQRTPEGPRSAGNRPPRKGGRRLVGVCLGVQGALHKQGPLLGPRQRTETLCRLRQQPSLALKGARGEIETWQSRTGALLRPRRRPPDHSPGGNAASTSSSVVTPLATCSAALSRSGRMPSASAAVRNFGSSRSFDSRPRRRVVNGIIS